MGFQRSFLSNHKTRSVLSRADQKSRGHRSPARYSFAFGSEASARPAVERSLAQNLTLMPACQRALLTFPDASFKTENTISR